MCSETFKSSVVEEFNSGYPYDLLNTKDIPIKDLNVAIVDEPLGRKIRGYSVEECKERFNHFLTNLNIRGFHFYIRKANDDNIYVEIPYKKSGAKDNIATTWDGHLNLNIVLNGLNDALQMTLSHAGNFDEPVFLCFTALSPEEIIKDRSKTLTDLISDYPNLHTLSVNGHGDTFNSITSDSGSSGNKKYLCIFLGSYNSNVIITSESIRNQDNDDIMLNKYVFIKDYELNFASFRSALDYTLCAPLIAYTEYEQGQLSSSGIDEEIAGKIHIANEHAIHFICVPASYEKDTLEVDLSGSNCDYPVTITDYNDLFMSTAGKFLPYKERVPTFYNVVQNMDTSLNIAYERLKILDDSLNAIY